MTPTRLAEILRLLRWGPTSLAREVGCTKTLVQHWLAGRYPIPPEIAAWLERRAAYHVADPPPRGWQQRTGLAA